MSSRAKLRDLTTHKKRTLNFDRDDRTSLGIDYIKLHI